MMRRNINMKWVIAVLAVTLFSAPGLFAQGFEDAYDLDEYLEMGTGGALNIAENGSVVGVGSKANGDGHGWYWDDEGMELLPWATDHELSDAYDVSETGVVVGSSFDIVITHMIKAYPHAAMWVNGTPQLLSSLATQPLLDFTMRAAVGINEKGQILGHGRYDSPTTYSRGFIFDNGVVTDIGALGGGTWDSEPHDINEQGMVVGQSHTSAGASHAFLWWQNTMADLHDTHVIPGNESRAWAINEAGAIVGYADFSGTGNSTATLWENGNITNLGVLDGNASGARDINDHGTIVGYSSTDTYEIHAFIKRANGKMQDLNDLIPAGSDWMLANAYSINNSGVIVGDGYHAVLNTWRPFMLVPDCAGGFQVYGYGFAGTDGYTPGLYGEGYPTSDGEISLTVVNGIGGHPGILLIGSMDLVAPIAPGVNLQILPLINLSYGVQMKGVGAGNGTWRMAGKVPTNPLAGTLYLQCLLLDNGVYTGFSMTNPLAVKIQ